MKLFLYLILLSLGCANGLKILGVFSFFGKSSSLLGHALMKHLAEAGHEVTYITPRPPEQPQRGVNIVDISSIRERYKSGDITNLTGILDRPNQIDNLAPLLQMLINLSEETVENPSVQKLLADKSQNFDLVIIEWAFNEIFTGFPAVYNCPYIWFSTLTPHWMILQLVDEASNPAYNSNALSRSVPPFTFLERATELWNLLWGQFVQRIYLSSTESETYEKLFAHYIRERNHIVPKLDELRYNASLVLSNSHVSTGLPDRLPINVIPIAGFHINPNTDPLPENLKKLMDNASQGVIYFSMGSNLESKHFPKTLIENILKVFGKLKQTVIWKFEEDLPNLPPNVHLLRWAPQHSILAHKNCILFISHGGLLSTTEAIHFGVPIIAIPARADQFLNVKRALPKGFVIKVDYSYNLAADLDVALGEMLSEPRYKQKAKELSFIYHDRPVPPAKELVHWVEHVAKTGGALHMRSPALMMPWYQKYYFDLLLIIAVFVYVLKKVVLVMFSLVIGGTKRGSKKKNE